MKIALANILVSLTSDKGRFYMLVAFLASVFLMGGSSRDDITSLVFLRPTAIFFSAYALVLCKVKDVSRLGLPFYLLCALAGLIAIQLVPLPPTIWTELPGRMIYTELSVLAGFEQPWRPLSLSPSETLNALFSLTIPLAMMLMVSIQVREFRGKIIIPLTIFGLLSVVLGIFQVGSLDSSSLYFYRISNFGDPIGFFANSNHQAVFLALLIPLTVLCFARSAIRNHSPSVFSWTFLLVSPLIVPVILLTGSRAGLGMGLLGIGLSFLFLRFVYLERKSRGMSIPAISMRSWLIICLLIILLLASFVTISFVNETAIGELFEARGYVGLRWDLLPVLFEMIWAYFPFGSGFGSFEHVYRQFEPVGFLSTSYLNQAHNDWFQILIEGGLPAALILAVFIYWVIGKALSIFRHNNLHIEQKMRSYFSLFVILCIGLSSGVDYPVRVPIMTAIFAIFCIYPFQFSEKLIRHVNPAR